VPQEERASERAREREREKEREKRKPQKGDEVHIASCFKWNRLKTTPSW